MKDCYDEGILDENFDKSSDANWMSLSTASKAFFTIDNGPPTNKANMILKETNKNAKFVDIDDLKSHLNNNQPATIYYSEASNYAQMYFIGAQAHDIDKLLFFMDWCYTEEGALTNCYGKLGETYHINKDGEAEALKAAWQPHVEKSDHIYQWMSAVGLNQLCFAPMMNIQDQKWQGYDIYGEEENDDHPWQRDSDKAWEAGYPKEYLAVSPDVEAVMTQRFDTIQAYLRNQIVSFIKGGRPMTEYDTFVADVKAMGIEELLAACNA